MVHLTRAAEHQAAVKNVTRLEKPGHASDRAYHSTQNRHGSNSMNRSETEFSCRRLVHCWMELLLASSAGHADPRRNYQRLLARRSRIRSQEGGTRHAQAVEVSEMCTQACRLAAQLAFKPSSNWTLSPAAKFTAPNPLTYRLQIPPTQPTLVLDQSSRAPVRAALQLSTYP